MAQQKPGTSELRLTNTMTRSKQIFKPRKGGTVKIFTCGPSIYRRPHIGNYRTFLFEDILVRYLEYKGNTVIRAISITDVEDKSISEAKKAGKSVQDLVSPVIDTFQKEAGLLHIKLPEVLPRASMGIDETEHLLVTLIGKGYAYESNGNIYFDPLKFKGFGRLYRLDMSRWPKKRVRYSLDTYPGQRWNLGDFILWHGYKGEDAAFWDIKIGKGRPSWNIQDPAVIMKFLGPQIDIHCGGIDNIYRHHDYNIAVMEAASGQELAPYWLHGEHLFVDGKKMSKEKGNVVYPEDLTEKGYTPEEIRFFLIYGHYRAKKNLTEKNITTAVSALRETRAALQDIHAAEKTAPDTAIRHRELIDAITDRFQSAMDDDLDVKTAFENVRSVIASLRAIKQDGMLSQGDQAAIKENIRKIDTVLQIFGGS